VFFSQGENTKLLTLQRPVTEQKMDELEVLMKQNYCLIAAVTECWDVTDETGCIKGYTNFFNTRRDRGLERRGGDVGLYFRKDIPCKLLSEPTDACHKNIWAECKPHSRQESSRASSSR
jgi:hypothetical protein